MCGIFGFIQAGEGKGPTINSLKAMAVAAETRGRHAFGLSWIDSEGRLHCYKQSGRIGQHLDVLNLCVGAKAVIGHTRWATHGDVGDNTNNHPHPVDGGWLVHNGIVTNYAELIRDHRLLPQSRCDSEVLGLLIERFKGSLLKRVRRTVEEVATDAPFAMAALWNRPGRVIVVKRGNPVFVGKGRTGNVYFCSCEAGLPGVVKPMDENTVFQFDLQSGTCQSKSVAERRVITGRVYEGSTTFTPGEGGGRERAPKWRDELEPPCGSSCGDNQFDDEDDGYDGSDESLFDREPDPNDPAAVQEAIQKQEAAEERQRRDRLSDHQRKALDLLERKTGATIPTRKATPIDPVKRLAELKQHGTIGGKPVPPVRHKPQAVKLKGGVE